MTGLLLSFAAFAAVASVVTCAAAFLIFGALGTAALLPRGAPLADGLREFAGKVPSFIWRATLRIDSLVILAAIALGVILTLVHS